jgi:hypothetical protein
MTQARKVGPGRKNKKSESQQGLGSGSSLVWLERREGRSHCLTAYIFTDCVLGATTPIGVEIKAGNEAVVSEELTTHCQGQMSQAKAEIILGDEVGKIQSPGRVVRGIWSIPGLREDQLKEPLNLETELTSEVFVEGLG